MRNFTASNMEHGAVSLTAELNDDNDDIVMQLRVLA